MSILHLCAENDSHEHDLDHDKVCSCAPNILDEGQDANGYPCKTIIHQVIWPMADGADRPKLKKVWVDAHDGHLLKIDTSAQQQQAYGARPRVRGAPGGGT